jgi:hypothetical protein
MNKIFDPTSDYTAVVFGKALKETRIDKLQKPKGRPRKDNRTPEQIDRDIELAGANLKKKLSRRGGLRWLS